MAEEDRSRDELSGMHRLGLRRICKARGMSSEECAKMEFDDMVDWIMEQQEGGGKKAPAKKAASKKAASKKQTSKKPPARKPRAKAEETPTDTEGEVSGNDLVNVLLEKIAALEEKVDTIGELFDKSSAESSEATNELRADVYGISRRQRHMHSWMVAEGILNPSEAPEGLDFETLEEAIEEECAGNGEGE